MTSNIITQSNTLYSITIRLNRMFKARGIFPVARGSLGGEVVQEGSLMGRMTFYKVLKGPI